MANNAENDWSIFAKKYIKFFLGLMYRYPKITVLLVFYAITIASFFGTLKFLGRIDLFPLVINLTGLFQIIIPTLAIVMIGAIWMLLIPSFWTIFAVTKWIPKSFLRKVPSGIILLPVFIVFVWLVFVLPTNSSYLIYCSPIISSSIIYIVGCNENIRKCFKFRTYKMFWCHLKLYAIFVFSSVLACFPLSFILGFIDDTEIDNLPGIIVLLFYFLVFLFIVYFPSLACLPSKSQNVQSTSGKKIIDFFMTMFAALVLLFMILPINLLTFINLAALQIIGITDTQINTYLIKNNTYVISDFPIDTWQTKKGLNTKNRIFIKGVNAISLGDTNLICPINFVQLRKDALKSKLTDIFNNNKSESLIKFQQENRKCITFNKDEISRWNFIE